MLKCFAHLHKVGSFNYTCTVTKCELKHRDDKLILTLNNCPCRMSIFRWFREFQRGNFTLKEAKKTGNPRTSVTKEDVTNVRKILDENMRVYTARIEKS